MIKKFLLRRNKRPGRVLISKRESYVEKSVIIQRGGSLRIKIMYRIRTLEREKCKFPADICTRFLPFFFHFVDKFIMIADVSYYSTCINMYYFLMNHKWHLNSKDIASVSAFFMFISRCAIHNSCHLL